MNLLCGIFDDEKKVIAAVRAAEAAKIPVHDVYTPFAVHGLDEAMGIRRSRLPWVCLVVGGLAGMFALGFQSWALAVSWPLNIGGKPFLAIPAFVPVTFEMTVLLGGLATVAAFLARCGLFPGKRARSPDPRVTDDRFLLAVARRDASIDPVAVRRFLSEHGAVEIFEKEIAA